MSQLTAAFLAFEMGLDGAVWAIADPAVDAQPFGLLLGPGAEEDALDPAGDGDLARDGHGSFANAAA